MKGKYYLGKTNRAASNADNGPKNCKAFLTWELKSGKNGPTFSMCGEVCNHLDTDIFIGGQCCDEIAALFPADKKAARMVQVWQDWHLNDLNAGTPEQEAAIQSAKDAGRFCADDWRRDHFGYACLALKEAGLYEVPLVPGMVATGGFPEEVETGARGYRYGERWLYRPIPADVIAEIERWAATC